MEIKEGDILVKNGIRNSYTDRYDMSEGDKFVFVRVSSAYNDTISVKYMKNDITYVMYARHFRDSTGEFIRECMWR